MKTYNCVHPRCNKKATSYCGHVKLGKKQITAGLCDEHSNDFSVVTSWKNGKPWRRKNGLVRYKTRLNLNTVTPYKQPEKND